eukprot:m.201296 g.201296  ORF g.201296 m.201296 type:complete len:733 (-) comp21374_c0_seq1:180-2378(-)
MDGDSKAGPVNENPDVSDVLADIHTYDGYDEFGEDDDVAFPEKAPTPAQPQAAPRSKSPPRATTVNGRGGGRNRRGGDANTEAVGSQFDQYMAQRTGGAPKNEAPQAHQDTATTCKPPPPPPVLVAGSMATVTLPVSSSTARRTDTRPLPSQPFRDGASRHSGGGTGAYRTTATAFVGGDARRDRSRGDAWRDHVRAEGPAERDLYAHGDTGRTDMRRDHGGGGGRMRGGRIDRLAPVDRQRDVQRDVPPLRGGYMHKSDPTAPQGHRDNTAHSRTMAPPPPPSAVTASPTRAPPPQQQQEQQAQDASRLTARGPRPSQPRATNLGNGFRDERPGHTAPTAAHAVGGPLIPFRATRGASGGDGHRGHDRAAVNTVGIAVIGHDGVSRIRPVRGGATGTAERSGPVHSVASPVRTNGHREPPTSVRPMDASPNGPVVDLRDSLSRKRMRPATDADGATSNTRLCVVTSVKPGRPKDARDILNKAKPTRQRNAPQPGAGSPQSGHPGRRQSLPQPSSPLPKTPSPLSHSPSGEAGAGSASSPPKPTTPLPPPPLPSAVVPAPIAPPAEHDARTRYFLIVSANQKNVDRSMNKSIWSTFSTTNVNRFRHAFNGTGGNVVFFYYVAHCDHLQGHCRMASQIRNESARWASPRGTKTINNVYSVEWLTRKPIPFAKVKHLKNTMNGLRPVWEGRDGQEIPHRVGVQLAALMVEHETSPSLPTSPQPGADAPSPGRRG